MLAILTGIGKLNDDMHYSHDVVAGATIGTSFGLRISYINAAIDRKESDAAVTPMIDKDITGLRFFYAIP